MPKFLYKFEVPGIVIVENAAELLAINIRPVASCGVAVYVILAVDAAVNNVDNVEAKELNE